MKLEFRLLGDLAVLADGRPLELGGTRQRSVLALLVLHRNRPIPTETIADRLWPDDQPLSAIKTIQVYVSRIRRTLGPAADRLRSSATGYRLAVADDELDAARFERGLRHAREALAAGSSDTALATLEGTLALWSGPALGDLAGEQFARREADRLEELRLQALEELHELRIAAGAGRAAIGELRRLLADQPGRERLWRLLMLALYADGRQGEALEAYQDARRYLAEELGLDPSPELRDLERAILTQEAPRARAAPLGAAVAAEAVEVEPPGRRSRRVVTVLRVAVERPGDDGALDPEILEAHDRRILDVVRHAVERHGGTIDHADHQGVTAVFGLPMARDDDAVRAVRAAYELKGDAAASSISEAVTFGVGVATGEILALPKDAHGSMLAGATLQVAAALAARAAAGEVLLATDTERLVRVMTSTEMVSFEAKGEASGPQAVRLLGLTEGDAVATQAGTLFVGRASELDALVAAFERVVSEGTPGLVTVIGAPGVGKSRLVAESFGRISERARILRSRCLPYGDGITYWPIRDLVLAASGIEADEPRDDALDKLDAIVSGLDRGDLIRTRIASIIGLAGDPVPGDEIPWAVRRFFEALAAERPLVLLVDDLQWAEAALVDLLQHVLDLGHGTILMVAIARPELEDVHPDVLARPSLPVIRLDALDDSDAASLLDHLAPTLPPGPLRSRIIATAEGNPLFVEQFVAYLSDEAGAVERILTHGSAVELTIPPTIGTLLAARLDRLPDVERRLLERAAVIGRTFWIGALVEIGPAAERVELPRRLARLARRNLIRPEHSDFPGDEAFRFRHLLIRDAAYASLPKRERAELHERFADWLEHRSAVDPGAFDLILAYHLEQAYRYRVELGDHGSEATQLAERALHLLSSAGLAANQRGDPRAAVSILKRAVDLAPAGPQRIELLLVLRRALRGAGEREASDAADAESVALLAEHPDEGLAQQRRMIEATVNHEITTAEALAFYSYFERTGDRQNMIRALEAAFTAYANRGERDATEDLLVRAIALADESGRPDLAAGLVTSVAFDLPLGSVPVPESLERCWRYLDLTRERPPLYASILLAIGELEARSGVRDRWRRRFEAAKAIIDDLGLTWPLGAANYPIKLGFAELAAGDPRRALELLRWSCTTLEHLGDLSHLATAAPLTAQTLLALGRVDEVEHFAHWGRDVATADDLDAQARWRIAVSSLRSIDGHHDKAIALAREAIRILSPSDFIVLLGSAHMTLAGALRTAGDEPAALVAASEARRLASAKQDKAALRTIASFLAVDG